MAIAFDAFSAGSSGASPKTVAHTVATPGANTAVYACILNDTADTVTGVTYNGNAMTQRQKETASGTFTYLYEWIGTSTAGAKNVVASSSSGTLYLSVISFTGVSAFDAGANGNDNGTTPINLPITTIAANCFAVAVLYDGGQSSTPTAGAGTTKAGANGDYSGVAVFYSTAALSAGSNNLVVNVGTASTNAWPIVSFSPAGGGGSPVTPSVNDAVTVAETVSMKMHLQNMAANDSVTATEAITMHMPLHVRMEKLS